MYERLKETIYYIYNKRGYSVSIDAVMKAKQKVAGLNQVTKAINRNKVYAVYVAKDADCKLVQALLSLCELKGVQVVRASNKLSLGRVCGVKNGTAAVAILQDN